METKNAAHTPEPWRIDPDYGRFNIIGGPDDNPTDVALIQMTAPNGRPDPMRAANGARINACVNACAGIKDPGTAIPKLIAALRSLVHRADTTQLADGSSLDTLEASVALDLVGG